LRTEIGFELGERRKGGFHEVEIMGEIPGLGPASYRKKERTSAHRAVLRGEKKLESAV